jgi:NADPH-dependent curcumin reductase CurA
MRAGGLGEIIHSTSARYTTGMYVTGVFGWTEYAKCNASQVTPVITGPKIELLDALGCLGVTGVFFDI